MEAKWAVASDIAWVIGILVEGWFFYRFAKPFLKNQKYAGLVGGSYSAVMLVLYFAPFVVEYPRLFGAAAAFLMMCLMDKRNIRQKFFLVVTMYLLQWIAQGLMLVPRSIAFDLFINTPYMLSREMLQFMVYVLVEFSCCIIGGGILWLMVAGIHKVYVGKRENVTWKELLLLLSMLLTVLLGYLAFVFFSDVYDRDTGQYIWNAHPEYSLLKVMYQVVSFSAMFITVAVYQRIKERQREEKENAILAGQMESMKNHISEVEKLYRDIRGLKHDMGTHIMLLENLLLKNEKEESEKYLSELKAKWSQSTTEIKTGNPVTDVILTEKQKEAGEKGIAFLCEFFFPVETRVGAFDVSILLNNAIANAIEGAAGCQDPYVSVSSYRKKNAYMIEVKNRIAGPVPVDGVTGLPETTKRDRGNHGFGLVNMRKVAQSYYGDIDIWQDGENFVLSIMLMVG